MGLKHIIIKIIRIFEIWEKIDTLPKWVRRAALRWELKLGHRPYDLTKHFVGKTYVYRIKYKTIEQGKVSERYYRKKRLK